MGFDVVLRTSDSPFVASYMHGRTIGTGSVVRPMEYHWHMVWVTLNGETTVRLTGPLSSTATLSYIEGVELLWIKLRAGAFMPHLPVSKLLDREITLPDAASDKFWLLGSAWQFPTLENADVFVDRLARAGILARDPLVDAALRHAAPIPLADRTLRERFVRATGLPRKHIQQLQRAQRAQELLLGGALILDTVAELGYYDQPHLTKSLKHFIGLTPADIARARSVTLDAPASG